MMKLGTVSTLAPTGLKQQLKENQQPPKLRTILHKSELVFAVIYEDEDVTPQPLNPLSNITERDKKITLYDSSGTQKTRSNTLSAFQTTSTANFFSKLHLQAAEPTSTSGVYKSYITVYVDDIYIEPELQVTGAEETSETVSKPRRFEPMAKEVTIVLVETPTVYILDIPSRTVPKDSEEAVLVEEDNKLYDFLTSEKGRNRKVVNAETQTVPVLHKSRDTTAIHFKTTSNGAFASVWDMYDTYKLLEKGDDNDESEFLEFALDHVNLDPYADNRETFEEKECRKLINNKRFKDAVCVLERLLANNTFNEQQKRFRGLSDPDPFRENIEYNYKLNLLWTFSNAQTQGRCVTSISLNPANEDIFAVGYGKFYFTDKTTGMVMLWNIKNPVQPERVYNFEDPVTCVSFSPRNFNLLVIAFYTGKVKVIDVSKHSLELIACSRFSDTPTVEPVWRVLFYEKDEYAAGTEHIVSISQDGKVLKLWPTDSIYLRSFFFMRIPRSLGKLKGLQRMRKCYITDVNIRRYAACLVIRSHPANDQIYYVATNGGVIHKCSINYHHQHLDEFLAHDGPCYQMKFSPFCNKLFITCGADWCVRIWADGINEPLMELKKTMMSVQGAEWSPIHSTIIASICGTEIYIWDLQRKIYKPQSITESPTNCRNTIVMFTSNGRCLIVGDIEGNVHVFSLEDMPFPAVYQDVLLRNSLFRALVTRPDLKRKLRRLGDLNFKKDGCFH